jgi:hypothetical protein
VISEELNRYARVIMNGLSTNDDAVFTGLVENFLDFLMTNFNNEEFNNLDENALKDFELCCTMLENINFHHGNEIEFCFVIKNIASKYKDINLLLERMSIVEIPSKISNIENEWQSKLKFAIQKLISFNDYNTLILTEVGKKIMMKGCGIRVMNQIKALLGQINESSKFPIALIEILKDLDISNEQKTTIIKWSIQPELSLISSDSINY